MLVAFTLPVPAFVGWILLAPLIVACMIPSTLIAWVFCKAKRIQTTFVNAPFKIMEDPARSGLLKFLLVGLNLFNFGFLIWLINQWE